MHDLAAHHITGAFDIFRVTCPTSMLSRETQACVLSFEGFGSLILGADDSRRMPMRHGHVFPFSALVS